MTDKKLKDQLEALLKKDSRLVDEHKELNLAKLRELVNNADEELIELLLSDKEAKKEFFLQVKDALVFKQSDFKFFLDSNKIDNSYTAYENRIGLSTGGRFVKDIDDVVLNFPYKDCVLEGGMTKEDEKRNEIFFNEVLAKDEIDRLEDPKAFTNIKRYTAKGDEKIKDFTRNNDGTITDNLIIKGNNLLVLHSLKREFEGKVKLIYIDPPYYFSDKKGGDTFAYNSNFKLSTWLVFMKNRLAVAKKLLTNDGAIFVQISDDGAAHLKLLLDQIFSPENFVNVISVRMKNIAGASGGGEDKKLKKNIEFICIYSNDSKAFEPFKNIYDYKELYGLIQEYKENEISWKYTSILYNAGKKKYICSTQDGDGNEIKIYEREKPIFKSINQICREKKLSEKEVYYKYLDKIFATAMPQSSIRPRVMAALAEVVKTGELISIEYIPRSGKNKGKIYEQFYKGDKFRLLSWLKDVSEEKGELIYKKELQGTYWDGFNLNNLSKEGKVQLENGKKPEELLQRVIDMSTNVGDIVLDYHLGSGTTAAVAHKMGRQYIGIEQLDYGENDSVIRLKNVINGDQSGISEAENWKGGGSFVYMELKKWNEEAKEKIAKCKSLPELKLLFKELCDKYFLHYNVRVRDFIEGDKENIKPATVEEEPFIKLPLKKQKELFAKMLDLNQLYINASEMEDKKYGLSKDDIALTKNFYSRK